MSKELKKGSVVFMKASSGLCGYGNAQCVSEVHGKELGTISLYGHNQHYKTYDIKEIVEAKDVFCQNVCHTCKEPMSNDCPRCQRLWES